MLNEITVAVIATVLNEGESIRGLLETLAAQTRMPDEVVIVDGGSSDGTVRTIEAFVKERGLPWRVLVEPGANISRGRNVAVGASGAEVIAGTDAGVRLEPGWLAELVAPFERDPSTQVVSGFFLPDPRSTFEMAMGAAVLPALRDVNPETFLPSSRSVAFRRDAFFEAGGYPEWLDFCEDLVFDFRLLERFGRSTWAFAPGAVVHFRPRGSLRAFLKQYYQYARGDGKADLWRKRHAVRYLTYLAAGPLLVVLALLHSPWWWVVLGAGFFFGMLTVPYRRLLPMLRGQGLPRMLKAFALVPVIRVAGDFAKMAGYPVGLAWRAGRLKTQPELRWR